MKRILMCAAAHYVLKEKRRGAALDPVTHFHLVSTRNCQ